MTHYCCAVLPCSLLLLHCLVTLVSAASCVPAINRGLESVENEKLRKAVRDLHKGQAAISFIVVVSVIVQWLSAGQAATTDKDVDPFTLATPELYTVTDFVFMW